jgi:amino acid permease
MNKRFYEATATLIGTVVGVGIFGVPYVVAKSGF